MTSLASHKEVHNETFRPRYNLLYILIEEAYILLTKITTQFFKLFSECKNDIQRHINSIKFTFILFEG